MSANTTPGFTPTTLSRAKQDIRCDFCEGRNGHYAECEYLAEQYAISAAEAAEYDADAEEEAFFAAPPVSMLTTRAPVRPSFSPTRA